MRDGAGLRTTCQGDSRASDCFFFPLCLRKPICDDCILHSNHQQLSLRSNSSEIEKLILSCEILHFHHLMYAQYVDYTSTFFVISAGLPCPILRHTKNHLSKKPPVTLSPRDANVCLLPASVPAAPSSTRCQVRFLDALVVRLSWRWSTHSAVHSCWLPHPAAAAAVKDLIETVMMFWGARCFLGEDNKPNDEWCVPVWGCLLETTRIVRWLSARRRLCLYSHLGIMGTATNISSMGDD